MRPILPGGRGPAVEDIQRRLLRLGYDLGPTGVDGVFLGKTAEAVKSFQAQATLSEDGVVGDETWAALVDATFTLGDRMLYLRSPYFHGSDVATMQAALNTLGFWCGDPDGIFGPFTEKGVREFQRSCGQAPDGIAGLETVRALTSLKHVWEGKEARTPITARVSTARAAEILSRVPITLVVADSATKAIAVRVANLAKAANEEAAVTVVDEGEGYGAGNDVVVHLAADAPDDPSAIVLLGDDVEATSRRIMTALAIARAEGREVVVDLGSLAASDEQGSQRAAVQLLDALCAALG